jgi:hypothetical protein
MEASAGSSLNYLLSSRGAGAPEEPPRVMELFDVIRTIKFIEQDDRVVSPTKSLYEETLGRARF